MKAIWQKWQNQFETLLVDKSNLQTPKEFNQESDFSLLKIPNLENINDAGERIILLFSRLSLCYEFGLLLERKDLSNNYQLIFGFDYGQIFSFDDNKLVALPSVDSNKVLKLKNTDWLKKQNIRGLAEQDHFTHLLLFPWPGVALLLSTKLADPWLKFHIEKTFEYLQKL
jgi:hypothetical protein